MTDSLTKVEHMLFFRATDLLMANNSYCCLVKKQGWPSDSIKFYFQFQKQVTCFYPPKERGKKLILSCFRSFQRKGNFQKKLKTVMALLKFQSALFQFRVRKTHNNFQIDLSLKFPTGHLKPRTTLQKYCSEIRTRRCNCETMGTTDIL